MNAIIDFITNIAEFISSIVDFIVQIFKDFIYILKLLKDSVLQLPQYLNWLPHTIVTLVLSAISVVIIYKVLGRD